MLNLLYKIFIYSTNDIKFIPYGLNTLTKKETMHSIVIQHNVFLNEAKIVSIFGIMEPEKHQVIYILSNTLYFTGMKPTRKEKTEAKYLLVSTNSKSYCSKHEADNIFAKCYRKNQANNNQTETSGRRKKEEAAGTQSLPYLC